MTVTTRATRAAALAARARLVGPSLWLAVLGVVGAVLASCFVAAVALVPLAVGIPLTAVVSGWTRSFTDLHRRRAAAILGVPVSRPYADVVDDRTTRAWAAVRRVVRDPASWRDALWLSINATVGLCLTLAGPVLCLSAAFFLLYPAVYAVTPPSVLGADYGLFRVEDQATAFLPMVFGVALVVLWAATQAPLLRRHAELGRSLLGPTGQAALRARVAELAHSRSDSLELAAAELRRVERDLHDGAQARLAALGMSLGLAEKLLAEDPAATRRLLTEARDSVQAALADLRALVRGIHPPVLSERGLAGAVRALVATTPITTELHVDLPDRLPLPVESAAYFTTAELVANAVKHSSATVITITLLQAGRHLVVGVDDNGRGGALLRAGGGLCGLQRRLSAFDARLAVDSPLGGPTRIQVRLPCASS